MVNNQFFFLSASVVSALVVSSKGLAQRTPSHADSSAISLAPVEPQTTAAKPQQGIRRYPFYLGAQAAAHSYMIASTNYPVQRVVINPLYVFVGYHVQPQLVVQVGFLQRNPAAREARSAGVNAAGQPISYYDYQDTFNAALPISLRYRFTGPRRWYVEGVLGVTTEFNRYSRHYYYTVNGEVYPQEQVSVRATNTYLTGGFSVGYSVSDRLALLLEAAALRNLTNRPGGNEDPAKEITPAMGVGARYNFDVRRKKS
jgi:hypothetical protein